MTVADLLWGCARPPTLWELDQTDTRVIAADLSEIDCASAAGWYLIADSSILQQILALKVDADSGHLANDCRKEAASHFNDHAEQLTSVLHRKAEWPRQWAHLETQWSSQCQKAVFSWLVFAEDIDTAEFSAAAAQRH